MSREKKLEKPNPIDQDFEALEEIDFPDQLTLARDLFAEVMAEDTIFTRKADLIGALEPETATRGEDIKHFLLPGMSGGANDNPENTPLLRESYENTDYYWSSPEHVFAMVRQGDMWQVPLHKKPLLRIGMSECSALIARSKEDVFVAHISLSSTKQISQVMDHFKSQEIMPEDIYTVASVGDYQVRQAKKEHMARATSIEDFKEAGIPAKNIVPFEYKTQKQGKQEHLHQGITRVLVKHDGFFVWSYDALETPVSTGGVSHEERQGDYHDERAIAF